MTPTLWIVAGPNGSGKSTIVSRVDIRDLIGPVELINPDEITTEILVAKLSSGSKMPTLEQANLLAVEHTEQRVKAAIEAGRTVLVETVLSTDKYLPVTRSARDRGFFVAMIYVALRTPALSIRRVAQRVAGGGHDVASDKVIARWERSHAMLIRFLPLLDRLWVFDNSDPQGHTRLIAEKNRRRVTLHDRHALPRITEALGTPPYDDELEQRLLGAILTEPRLHSEAAKITAPEHFANRVHGDLFHAMTSLFEKDLRPDATTLRNRLAESPDIAELGGATYLMRIRLKADAETSTSAIQDLARKIRYLHDLRIGTEEREWEAMPVEWLNIPQDALTKLRADYPIMTIGDLLKACYPTLATDNHVKTWLYRNSASRVDLDRDTAALSLRLDRDTAALILNELNTLLHYWP